MHSLEFLPREYRARRVRMRGRTARLSGGAMAAIIAAVLIHAVHRTPSAGYAATARMGCQGQSLLMRAVSDEIAAVQMMASRSRSESAAADRHSSNPSAAQ